MTARARDYGDVRNACAESVGDRLRRVLAVHFDPTGGTPFWLERAARLRIDPRKDIQTLDHLHLLGATTTEELNAHSLEYYIPRQFHDQMHRFVIAQTGGTTGAGTWTAYREDEFQEAFVEPFIQAVEHVGFPTGEKWLFVGPSGPHVIGKVVRWMANARGSGEPFGVDFDPRWAKKMPDNSFGRRRYLQHVIDQAIRIIQSQDIGVLFTTPAVLEGLAAVMNDRQRERIRGVHYGGMTVTREQLQRFQVDVFPNAVHLSGYGNTLFGCCLELSTQVGRAPEYFPLGNRLIFEVGDKDGVQAVDGAAGQVRFTRLDESMMIVRMAERDAGRLVHPPAGAPSGFVLPGIGEPHPLETIGRPAVIGLY